MSRRPQQHDSALTVLAVGIVTVEAPRANSRPGQAGPAGSLAGPAGHADPAKESAVDDYPDRDTFDAERLVLVTDLREAIAAGRLDVVFQPKVDLEDRRIRGVEALARWEHPDRGAIPPAEFIPVAEHTGLIDPLTELVLERALTEARTFDAAGAGLSVAVNVSIRTLRRPSFPERVAALLARSGIAPSVLVLEVTEGVLSADPERTLHGLDRLSALGVGLSIDDLGTGNSSLAYLRRLPVDEMKIDRSFVLRIGSDPDDAAVVGTIVQLGHRLGKRVVAEGVEDGEAWAVLRRLGCDLAQGFWICRPQPAEELLRWLRREWQGPVGGGPQEN